MNKNEGRPPNFCLDCGHRGTCDSFCGALESYLAEACDTRESIHAIPFTDLKAKFGVRPDDFVAGEHW